MPGTLRTLIDRPREVAARRWVFQCHLWCGAILGVYFLVVGVTGGALVFRPEGERALVQNSSRGDEGRPRPFQTAWRDLRRVYPHSTFGGMSISQYPPVRPDAPYRVKVQSGTRGSYVYVDHWTGTLVGRQHAVIAWVADLHYNLSSGATGLWLNAAGGVLLAGMCLSGLVLWWPGRRQWKRGLVVRWRMRWQVVNYDLHAVVGAVAMALLAAVALSGSYIAVRNALRFPQEGPAWQSSVVEWPVDLDVIVDRANAALPGGELTGLSLPQRPTDPFRIQKEFSGTSATVIVDPRTGEVLRIDRTSIPSLSARINAWIGDVHYGRVLGFGNRIAWVALGLVPAGLLVTGLLMWWSRVGSKRVRQAQPAFAVLSQRLRDSSR